jgi:hypothetical protein
LVIEQFVQDARSAGLTIPVVAAVAVFTDVVSAAVLQGLPGLELDQQIVDDVVNASDPVEAGIEASKESTCPVSRREQARASGLTSRPRSVRASGPVPPRERGGLVLGRAVHGAGSTGIAHRVAACHTPLGSNWPARLHGENVPALRSTEGNHFPTEESLLGFLEEAGLGIEAWRGTAGMAPPTRVWQSRVEKVAAKLSDRHGGKRSWQLAERQSKLIGELLAESVVTGELLTLRRR